MNHARRKLCIGALAGTAAALLGAVNAQGKPHATERIIKVTARKFQFIPREIHLRQGEAVVLELTALDFVHGFNVPGLHLRADLPPGPATRIRIPTDQAGVFDFLCDNFCGSGHEEMNGKLIVT
jgi:cytochrome c oxidase subunit 2